MGLRNEKDNKVWDEYYLSGGSRYQNEGDIGVLYRLPKFASMLRKHLPSINGMKILEIGGGVGEMYENITKEYKTQGGVFYYTITEYAPNAVNYLKNIYKNDNKVTVAYADAQNLPFDDNMFDLVLAFDVLHHVEDPHKMISEMVRVSSKYIYLCDAGGLSLIRKITEHTKSGKKNGEKSYTPAKIRKFFKQVTDKNVYITPFYFFVPPKVKKEFMKPFIIISEIGQRIPFIKWQSQSVSIFVDNTDESSAGETGQ